jgi:O-antigen ligase
MRHRLLSITAAWSGLGAFLALVAPRSSYVLVASMPFVPLAWSLYERRSAGNLYPSKALLILACTAIFISLQAFRSPLSADAFRVAVFVVVAVVALWTAKLLFRAVTADVRAAVVNGLIIGFLIGSIALLFEVLTQGMVRCSWFPNDCYPPTRTFLPTRSLSPHDFNRSAAMLVIFLPLVAAALRVGRHSAGVHNAGLVGLALGSCVIFLMVHKTSWLAFFIGLAIFALARLWTNTISRLLAVALIGLMIAIAPGARLLFSLEMYDSPYVGTSVRERLVIWNMTAAQISAAPVFGAGMYAGRVQDMAIRALPEIPKVGKAGLVATPGWHTHNAFLQALFETGIVGAGFLLALFLLALSGIAVWRPDIRPFGFACWAIAVTLCSAAVALWSVTTLAMFALVVGWWNVVGLASLDD